MTYRLCNHADAGALTIAFDERALPCLQGSSKHRRILSRSAKADRGGRVTPRAVISLRDRFAVPRGVWAHKSSGRSLWASLVEASGSANRGAW
jgi:hypothetical protein